ncbi:hypothetical protein [Clostridium saccharoperbutylacetonicum]|uniref:hypothetical protein n=1 Tax=Clostridium saccharoperbutylacetonicum TaxID=36745 RepID=UPI0039EA5E0F
MKLIPVNAWTNSSDAYRGRYRERTSARIMDYTEGIIHSREKLLDKDNKRIYIE